MLMASSGCLLLILLQLFSALFLTLLAQDQSGFISLSCGSPSGISFREKATNITYISDANYINTGVSRSIKQVYRTDYQQQTWQVRSFPEGSRNCYTLNLTIGDKYLIRASFLHGGYDDKPVTKFELHLGPNLWSIVSTTNETNASVFEMIHLLTTDRLQICLVKTGNSTPFISVLELRKLMNTTYVTQQGSLQLVNRVDVGAITDRIYRYDIDVFDRVWIPYNFDNCSSISTNETVNVENDYKPPQAVMVTASVPTDPDKPMNISLVGIRDARFYVAMQFAEIQELSSNETREFNIMYNDKHIYGPFRPLKLTTTSVFTPFEVVADANGKYEFSLQRTGNSTLPPLLNAMEVYSINMLPQQETDQKQVYAMMNIKVSYGVDKMIDWEGDPCAPRDYRWSGVNCSYTDNEQPKIITLNLSASGLTGEILEFISDLTNLEVLDLSNNTLTGSVPEFLANMETLKLINLSDNELNGSIPESLLDRARKGSLSLRIEGNTGLCSSASCGDTRKNKKTTVVAPVVASLVSLLLIGAGIFTFLILKRKKRAKLGLNPSLNTGTTPLHSRSHHDFESPVIARNRKLTYMDVLKITNNFERVLGKGGFGVVYYGVLDYKPVAVKMLTESTALGYKQFKAEVELLLRVHHKDLTCLVGYCEEGDKICLIYEFMANGDLKEHLSGLVFIQNVPQM